MTVGSAKKDRGGAVGLFPQSHVAKCIDVARCGSFEDDMLDGILRLCKSAPTEAAHSAFMSMSRAVFACDDSWSRGLRRPVCGIIMTDVRVHGCVLVGSPSSYFCTRTRGHHRAAQRHGRALCPGRCVIARTLRPRWYCACARLTRFAVRTAEQGFRWTLTCSLGRWKPSAWRQPMPWPTADRSKCTSADDARPVGRR